MTHEEIKALVAEMKTQDNRATQYPLFYIQDKKTRWVHDEADYDIVFYIDGDGEKRGEGSDAYLEEFTTEDGDTIAVRCACIKYVWETVNNVGPFLTEKAANAHIEANNYHYTEPRTYVYSAWRNYEMQKIMNMLFELVGEKVPQQYEY